MSVIFQIAQVLRSALPSPVPEFTGHVLWQSWFLDDELLPQGAFQILHEKKNHYVSHEMFRTVFLRHEVTHRAQQTVEANREVLQEVEQEIAAMCSNIVDALAKGEDYEKDHNYYDQQDLDELRQLAPLIRQWIETFDFDQYVLLVDIA